MTMICKKCKKAFRKDVSDMESPDEADEYCPHCDNHFLREAITAQNTAPPDATQLKKDSG
jgi:NAD-dependent SIR2 family protein deacetylase